MCDEVMCVGGTLWAVVSWWGRPDVEGTADTQGVNTDLALPLVVAAAERSWTGDSEGRERERVKEGMRIAFHLEPYPGRTAASVREDVAYLSSKFGDSVALLRGTNDRPVYFVYDSYHVSPRDWATLLTPEGAESVRGSSLDGVFVGLWLTRSDGTPLEMGGFDGGYTYFASPGTSHGADPRNWRDIASEAAARGLMFIPSVGPGYNDTKIRPWNAAATRSREGGRAYARAWSAALGAGPAAVTITSYNEWGEGTQIEPAAARRPGYATYRAVGTDWGDGRRDELNDSF